MPEIELQEKIFEVLRYVANDEWTPEMAIKPIMDAVRDHASEERTEAYWDGIEHGA